MSTLQGQDIETFSSPINTKKVTQEARSSDRLKGSNNEVINALKLLWKSCVPDHDPLSRCDLDSRCPPCSPLYPT